STSAAHQRAVQIDLENTAPVIGDGQVMPVVERVRHAKTKFRAVDMQLDLATRRKYFPEGTKTIISGGVQDPVRAIGGIEPQFGSPRRRAIGDAAAQPDYR